MICSNNNEMKNNNLEILEFYPTQSHMSFAKFWQKRSQVCTVFYLNLSDGYSFFQMYKHIDHDN